MSKLPPRSSKFKFAPLFDEEDRALLSAEQVTFLEARQRCPNDEPALGEADVTARTLTRWLEDELFAELYGYACEGKPNEAEHETWHRALHGYAQVLTGKDGQPYYIRDPLTGEPEYDADGDPILVVEQVPRHELLLPLLKARKAEYRDKGELMLGGVKGSPVEQSVRVEHVLPEGLTMEDYMRRWAEEDARHGSSWPKEA